MKKTVGDEKNLLSTGKKRIKELVKKPKEKFLNKNQKNYWNLLDNNEIIFCYGPSGTGKSYLSIKKAIELLCDEENNYDKILIIRPAVEVGQSIGMLPGDIVNKINEYIVPSYYLINKIIGKETTEKLKNEGFIETAAVSFLRGWNVDNTILVAEEIQNLTIMELKMILTRIGFNSKFILSGDVEQSDKFKNKDQSGLAYAIKNLKNINKVGFFEFTDEDIVRNPLISEILKRF